MTLQEKDTLYAQQPEDLHQLFVTCVNAHDVDALLTLYEHEATVADLEGHAVQGVDNLRRFLSGFLLTVKQIDGNTRKVLVSGDIALLSSTWWAILTTSDGGAFNATGTSAEVARRQQDGTWRFLVDDPQFVNVPL